MNKPYVIVKKYCANHLEDGTCNGMNFKGPKWEHVRFLPEGVRCLVACGQRCPYFETAVLPMKDWDWTAPAKSKLNIITIANGRAFKEAADQYRRKHSGIRGLAPKQRTCPDCGTDIGPRRRYCVLCAVERREENNRKNQRTWYHKNAKGT